MSSADVVIVRTGLANLASVQSALARLGLTSTVTEDAAQVRSAARVILPGVGAFGPGMRMLRASGLAGALRERIEADRPTLAVCLGMQLLCAESEESPGETGLGIVDASVRRFAGEGPTAPRLTVPHMGWNRVSTMRSARLVTSGDAYFANSYRIGASDISDGGWTIATCNYAGEFVAAMERGNVLACQFHPELSGAWGLSIIARWAGLPPEVCSATEAFTSVEQDQSARTDASQASGLLARIIPCLDVRGGRIVKGVKFANLRDAGDPVERAALYEREGADEIVILDVSATTEERAHAVETVERVRAAIAIPLTVGGGVRRVEDAARLLDAGADKVAVNTAAVSDPGIIDAISERFGRQCTVLAVDAARRESADGWEVVVRSGTERTGIDAVAWCARGAARGAGEILLTSWDRDGTGEGYDLALLHEVCGRVGIPVIASGGVASSADLGAGLRAGASAVLAASIFHDGVHRVVDVKREVTEATGIPMRACKVPHTAQEEARP